MPKVRIDKWLWSVRIFKTRTRATDACKNNKVLSLTGTPIKASTPIQAGDQIIVKKDGFSFRYQVIKVIAKRVGAPLAVACYSDLTPPEELYKFEKWFSVKRMRPEFREKGEGRPTKKERREIDKFKLR